MSSWISEYNKIYDEYRDYVSTGQYLAIRKPEHPKARSDGYVYIHQLQAEKKLGRKLNESEVVHHIDEDKHNNAEENLIVFKTNSDHIAFHHGCDIELDGDVYVAINKSVRIGNNLYKVCPVCHRNLCYFSSDICRDCYLETKKSQIKPDLNTLKHLIMEYSISSIGKMFHVSGNAVRKWCISYDLPYKRNDICILKSSELL